MIPPATNPDPNLAAAQQAFDDGRLQPALAAARAASSLGDPALRIDGLRLRALAAFRLGELDEAADAAQDLLAQLGDNALTYPSRVQVLSVSVVAAGELGRFDQALTHLQQMLAVASRGGSLEDYVRARGTAAICFALLGDAWAGQRLLSELLGLFQGLPAEVPLEWATRNNHAGVSLRIARLARDGGDAPGCSEALDHAEASLQRSAEISRVARDAQQAAMADIHASELALLRDQPAAAAAQLQTALAHPDMALLSPLVTLSRVMLAEAFNGSGEPGRALALVQDVNAGLREGHQLGLRIRCAQQLQRACTATGADAQALAHAARARQLEQALLYRQLHAQSRFLRMRLELEHLYRYRASTSRGVTSRPGNLTMPAPLDTAKGPSG